MELHNHGSRNEKLTRKQVHLDLTSLPAAIVDDTIHPDGRSFRCSRRVDVNRWLDVLFTVAKLGMPDFMGYQKRLVECGSCCFMEDGRDVRVKECSTAIKHGGT
ncbi:thiamine biosynthesis enzyme ThiH [Acidovorax sp. MR-S7]|nr:thiamine biosynthesis enzyme ThiH [Acidovorax sp. MR-S7]